MVVVAGLLVLAGLGLFVGGLATGTTSWYWACVACCAVAAALLVLVRLRPGPRASASAGTSTAPAAAPTVAPIAGSSPATGPGGRRARHAAPEDAGETPSVEPAEQPATADPVPAAEVAPAAPPVPGAGRGDRRDPAEEDVEVTDLLMVVDLRDEVLVVDQHPRYHMTDCAWLRGRTTVPLPVREARTGGFTPCAVCRPDSRLADVERARKAARRG